MDRWKKIAAAAALVAMLSGFDASVE